MESLKIMYISYSAALENGEAIKSVAVITQLYNKYSKTCKAVL